LRTSAGFLALVAAALMPVPVAAAAPRPAQDWSRTVAATPSGAYRMGNPRAKVKLVEYVSLTCPHCRAFDQNAGDALIKKYVKTGKVSLEYRNFVRDAYDVSAALISRCNGATGFFRLTRALLKDQPAWTATAEAAPSEQVEALQNLPPGKMFAESARIAGLQKWAAVHGVPAARANRCLADEKAIERLMAMTAGAIKDHPGFPGTPSFLLNGKLLEDTSTWEELEPKLRAALGG